MYPKDIFFIHTKGDSFQRALADHIETALAGTIVSLWCYDDWNWTERFRDPVRRVYKREGMRIDPRRGLFRDPKPFVHQASRTEVDRDTIRKILRESIVIALFEPEEGNASAGVDLEHTLLKDIIERKNSFEGNLPVIIRFFIKGNDSKTFASLPISWESSVDPGDASGSFCDCVLMVCGAWLMHTLWLRSGALGRRLVALAGKNDPMIAGIFKGWNGTSLSMVSLDVDHESVASPQAAQSEERNVSGNSWQEQEDERITRELARLDAKLDEDRVRHALMGMQEILGRYSQDETFRDSYRTFSNTLRSLQVVADSQ